MPLAITLRADADGERALGAWRDAIAAFEDVPSMAALGYAPHLTLAVYEDDRELELATAFERLTLGLRPLQLTFTAVRWFDGPPLTIWASPERDNDLDAAHSALHAAIDPARCHPHYRPGRWMPHCTLGNRIRPERRGDALAFVRSRHASLRAGFDRLDLVAFLPVAVRRSILLAAGQ